MNLEPPSPLSPTLYSKIMCYWLLDLRGVQRAAALSNLDTHVHSAIELRAFSTNILSGINIDLLFTICIPSSYLNARLG
jgi:hypothetical protein